MWISRLVWESNKELRSAQHVSCTVAAGLVMLPSSKLFGLTALIYISHVRNWITGVLSTLSSENSERCPRTHTQTEMNLNSKQRQQQLSLRCVLSGCSGQRTLRYSREKDPIIFDSSPDVSRVLGRTRFRWIYHFPTVSCPQNLPNTLKAMARGGWGTIT